MSFRPRPPPGIPARQPPHSGAGRNLPRKNNDRSCHSDRGRQRGCLDARPCGRRREESPMLILWMIIGYSSRHRRTLCVAQAVVGHHSVFSPSLSASVDPRRARCSYCPPVSDVRSTVTRNSTQNTHNSLHRKVPGKPHTNMAVVVVGRTAEAVGRAQVDGSIVPAAPA